MQLQQRRRFTTLGIWIVVTVIVSLLPLAGIGVYGMRQIILVATMALVVSGLNLSFGYAGELALGQAAVYAAGAYVTAFVASKIFNDILLTMVLAAAAALVIGLISGIPGLRLGGWLLAVTSFFLVLLIQPVLNLIGAPVGGYEGFTGIPLPNLFGLPLGADGYFVVVVVATSLWFGVFRNLVTSLHGNALRVLKTSPVLAESLGIPRFQMKLKAYALGAIPAGIAGTLSAYLDGYIAPDSFGLNFAISVLAACILGGSATVYGPFFGSAIIVLVPLWLTAFREFAFVAYGFLLVIGGVFLRRGVVGYARLGIDRLLRRRRAAARQQALVAQAKEPATTARVLPPIDGKRLVVSGVSKSFGGNKALNDISFTAEAGQVTALIGPNGSGKTTLLNLISGFYRVDSGTVVVGDRDVTRLSPARVSTAGIGRTFQTPLVPEDMTVLEVVITGMYGWSRSGMLSAIVRTPKYERARALRADLAQKILKQLGLQEYADTEAVSLALGTRRMLELARVLAGEKSVVLLDEVASGLDEAEVVELAEAVRQLSAAGATVVLVEHNFALVKQIADSVVVLADGNVLAEGTPAEVEANEHVARVYLGEGAAISGTRTGTATDGTAK